MSYKGGRGLFYCVCMKNATQIKSDWLIHWFIYSFIVSSLLLQVDVTKCVVNSDPNFRSHWLVSAVCAFGHYLKATVLYLLREKWKTQTGPWVDWPSLYTTTNSNTNTNTSLKQPLLWIMFTLMLHWAFIDEHFITSQTFLASSASSTRFSIYCEWSYYGTCLMWMYKLTHC